MLTGAIFLLQLFPYTGIFLMFVLAMFWSVVTINLGFLSLLIEVPSRGLSKAWLALPIAWFGGYAGLAYLSHQLAAILDQELRTANAAQHVAFEAERQSLVFDSKSHQLSVAAHHFVQNYRLPVAYQTNAGNRELTHRALRVVADPLCQTVRTDPAFSAADVRVSPVYEGPGYFGRPVVKGICVLTAPEEPGGPRVLVAARQEKHKRVFVPHTVTHLAIRMRMETSRVSPSGKPKPCTGFRCRSWVAPLTRHEQAGPAWPPSGEPRLRSEDHPHPATPSGQ